MPCAWLAGGRGGPVHLHRVGLGRDARLQRELLVLRLVVKAELVGGLAVRDLVVLEPDADPLQLARELPAAASTLEGQAPSCAASARASERGRL